MIKSSNISNPPPSPFPRLQGHYGNFAGYVGLAARDAFTVRSLAGSLISSLDDLWGLGDNLAGNCFPAGTPVSTEEGLRPIETIRAGDRVWAFDHVNDVWKLKRVLKNFERGYQTDMVHVTIAGETIQSTMLHPYWVSAGKDLSDRPIRSHLEKPPEDSQVAGRWVDATDLRIGDRMLLRNGREATVENIRHEPANTIVYNFAIDELRCYAVGENQVLVHNTNGSEGLDPNTKFEVDPVFRTTGRDGKTALKG